MSNQSKKLTLAGIKESNKIYTQKQKVELSDGSHLFIYPHFAPGKLSDLIKEIVTDKQRAENVGINFDEINMADYVLYNIVYKFADLAIPNDIKKKIQAFTELINYECFGEIITAFPQESITKLQVALDNFNENLEVLIKNNLIDTKVENLLDEESEITK